MTRFHCFLLWAVLMTYVSHVVGHVVLTFPSARPFALDGLENVSSKGPCGMEYNKGHEVMTSLVSGTSFVVTWHSAYPHLGGVKLQILELDGSVLTELTDDEFIYQNDTTKLSHEVVLDSEMSCDHCVLRILRQASEWSGTNQSDGFLFWSCADISIISETTAEEANNCYKGRCMNGGSCSDGKCECKERFEGERCEYENDCAEEDSCGHGRCVETPNSHYPRKVCYCEAGWMGRFCEEESVLSEAVLEESDEKDYFKIELYKEPKFELFWKLIDDVNEIEIALRVETDTWSAIGFRPEGLNFSCTNFPENILPEPEVEINPNDANDDAEDKVSEEPTLDKNKKKRRKRSQKPLTSRARREVVVIKNEKVNVIEQLCNDGKVANAETWATWSFNQDLNISVSELKSKNETTNITESQLLKPSPEYHNKKNLHPMDCSDIVFATAHGDLHRIVDSYTRDRSTPQPDYWYGDKDDLTAAVAVRKDGILHIRFRRKLNSDENSDYSIEDALMRLIWARGQTPSLFHHKPFSGLEHCNASNYNFYRVNELKYHGTKPSQRGTLMFNFYDNPDNPSSSESFKFPDGCDDDDCEYTATWRYRQSTDKVYFQISAVVEKEEWAAIGFSENKKMEDSDAVIGWVDPSNGELTLTDRWLATKSADGVAIDNGPSSFEDAKGSYNDGKLKISFSRLRNTKDSNDLDLTQCVYFLYAWGGGLADGDISKHAHTSISKDKICIGSNGVSSTSSMVILLICLLFSLLPQHA